MMASSVVSQGGTLLLTLLLARMLPATDFGRFAMVTATLSTLTSVASLGLGAAATRFVSEYWHSDREQARAFTISLFRLVTASSGAVALLLAVSAPWISQKLLKDPAALSMLWVVVPALLVTSVNSCQQAVLLAIGRTRGLAGAVVVSSVTGTLLAIVLASAGGAREALAATVGGMFLRWILFNRELAAAGLRVPISALPPSLSFMKAREVSGYVVPAAISGFITMPVLWLAQSFVYRMPGGPQEVGAFAVAMQFRALALFVPVILNGTATAVLNRALTHDRQIYHRLYRHHAAVSTAASGAAALLLGLIPETLLSLAGRTAAPESLLLIRLLLASAVAESAAIAAYQAVQSAARMWQALWLVTLPRDLLFLCIVGVLAAGFGARALAAAHVISWLVCLAAIWWMAQRLVPKMAGPSE